MTTSRGRELADSHRFQVDGDQSDRLDAYLADRLHLSRSRIAELIDRGLVTVDGRAVRKSHKLRSGQVVEVTVPAPPPVDLDPEPIPIPIVYEDEHLAVVDKPAGLVVHPAAGHRAGTLVNGLLHHLGGLSPIGLPDRPGIVHRLDKDTSGLMVVAREERAHLALVQALASRRIRRGYIAASWGHLASPELSVDRPIARDPSHRQRMAVVEGGRPALTHVRRLEAWRAADLIALRLHTGRTHQIRVHLQSLGHPVVGDPIYGAGWQHGFSGAGGRWARELARLADRLFLHSARLSFRHPVSGEVLRFSSPLPEPLASAVRWARGSSGPQEP